MKYISVPSGIIFLFLLASPLFPQTSSKKANAVGPFLAKRHTEWIEAMKRKDVDAMLALYDPDAVLLAPEDDGAAGEKAIRAFYERQFAKTPTLSNADIASTSVISNGEYVVEAAESSGDTNMPEKGDVYFRRKSLIVWKHEVDGSWKIYREAWNDSEAK